MLVGIDENGLGPRLGPLVVTGVGVRARDAAAERLAGRPARGALKARLGDSKALVSYDDMALGEAWARVVARKMTGAWAERPDEVLAALTLDARDALRAPCPSAHVEQCWDATDEAFVADEALVGEVQKDLDKLAKKGLELAFARVVVVCSKRLNEAADVGRTRFEVDLHAMERLVLAARDAAGGDVAATCGKVGGYDRYADSFGPLSGRLHVALEEGRAKSAYKFPGVGEIAFVRDADASNVLVSLASLVGKWARDLLMARVVRYHRAEDPELPPVSGYHDPITARFVDASRLARARRGVPDECFERRRATEEPASSRKKPKGDAPASARKKPRAEAG